jgi:hypothetical protein
MYLNVTRTNHCTFHRHKSIIPDPFFERGWPVEVRMRLVEIPAAVAYYKRTSNDMQRPPTIQYVKTGLSEPTPTPFSREASPSLAGSYKLFLTPHTKLYVSLTLF